MCQSEVSFVRSCIEDARRQATYAEESARFEAEAEDEDTERNKRGIRLVVDFLFKEKNVRALNRVEKKEKRRKQNYDYFLNRRGEVDFIIFQDLAQWREKIIVQTNINFVRS